MIALISSRRSTFVLVAAASLSFTLPVSAARPVPFRGSVDITVTGAEPTPDGLLLTGIGTGKATHLGKFTREEQLLLQADGTFTGTVVFTAANGDRLVVNTTGGFTSPTTAVGTYSIVDGTGRFANATGTASFRAVTSDGVHFSLVFRGSIDF